MRNGDKMLDPGTIIGLLIAVAVIGVFFYVLFLCMKKDNKELDKILSGLTKEDTDRLLMAGYVDYEGNYNFVVKTSYIYDIVKKQGNVEVKLLFIDDSSGDYRTDIVNMSEEVFNQKGLYTGKFVKSLHNKNSHVWLKTKDILE